MCQPVIFHLFYQLYFISWGVHTGLVYFRVEFNHPYQRIYRLSCFRKLNVNQKAVTIKALKNKDRMSVEAAVEVLSPEVQRAIPTEDVVTTIVPEIYTFWRQNRPGILTCPVDVAVHQPTGTIFFSDQFTHQIMKSDLHCPANLSSIAGESNSGLRDGRKSLFQNPSLLCIYANLIFVCDSGNAPG